MANALESLELGGQRQKRAVKSNNHDLLLGLSEKLRGCQNFSTGTRMCQELFVCSANQGYNPTIGVTVSQPTLN